MRHAFRLKLVVLSSVAVGSALAALSLAACSIDIDGTGAAPADSGPLPDATTSKADTGALDAAMADEPFIFPVEAGPVDDSSIDSGPTDAGTGNYPGNNAALFSGHADGFVNVDMTLVKDDFTLEAWINPSAIAVETDPTKGNQLFVADNSGANTSDWYSYLYHPDIMNTPVLAFSTSFTSGGPSSLGLTNRAIATGVWTHVAIVRKESAGQVLFYLNGAINVNTPDASTAALSDPKAMDIGGGITSGGTNGFEGLIDEVRVWNYARTAGQIAGDAVYQLSDTSVADTGLVLYYRFDEAAGATTTVDSSKSGLAGTVMGSGANAPVFGTAVTTH